ncbi:MAG: trans-2-enoyl-CoA reductase family protein [Treponema sp.]|nr:trans-2-enoyl-CoA reductase family protein [Treponema sp.]
MIIKPRVRNNICINSHPQGCAVSVQRQIEYAKEALKPVIGVTPKLALVIGCSNGYGLASRIAAAFGYGAATVGISKEKPATQTHTATPGFYNNRAFEKEAAKAALVYKTIDGNAFSDEMKADAAQAVREAAAAAGIPEKIDLIVYSLASPVRVDPKTGVMYKSALKPIGAPFSGKTLDIMTGSFNIAEIGPAAEEEIASTVKVMGGEDWELWIEALDKEGLLSPQTRTVAYTYLGPEHSWPIYKNGTIGRAKEDLERACRDINKNYAGKIAGAWISVNKALVTRSSAIIPIIPLYLSCLFRVMKDMGLHEDCIRQIARLYRDHLYQSAPSAGASVDSEGRIRIDDLEMRDDVQRAVMERMNRTTPENVFTETDIAGIKRDFLNAHGFEIEGVDYSADIAV